MLFQAVSTLQDLPQSCRLHATQLPWQQGVGITTGHSGYRLHATQLPW